MTDLTTLSAARYGLIAQQAREACFSVGIEEPLSWVDDTDPECWAIDYDQIVAPLIRAVQQLSDKITRLEDELNDLRKR